ncbi:MAG: PhzF family phenazine biosynthesis protein [Acidobacteria bacterium]|nr:PhzF family phenazine biosynthesis protein [Acidobacteriota bacterium]
MKLDIFQVDAFTNKPFGGNPAAVVPLDNWLAEDLMQKIALENNLAETAFFVRNGDAYDIRWFTPTFEIDLCGHATLATAFVIFNVLNLETDKIRFHSHKSGALSVEKNGDILTLDFPVRRVSPVDAPEGLFEAIGGVPKEIFKARDYFLVYETEREVLDLKPDFSALHKIAAFLKIDAHGFIVTAPGDSSDFVSRFFAPEIGVFEDPVTGSSHCNLIPFWAERLGKEKMFARQVSARGGELFCELAGDRVKIGGNAVLYLKGEIYVDAGEKRASA